MVYIKLVQDDITKEIGLINNEKELKNFIFSLKKICKVYKDDYGYYLDKSDLKDYAEIIYNNKIIPISQFEFSYDTKIYVEYNYLRNLSDENDKDEYFSIIENYSIPYSEMKDYIEKREKIYKRVKNSLEKRGYKVSRTLQGSEDGEAIAIDKPGSKIKYFSALDPYFVDNAPEDDEKFELMIDEYLS